MTQKLDDFLPSPNMTQGVKRNLIEAGVPHETIPMDWAPAFIAATFKLIATNPEAAAYVVDKLLHFDVYRGDDDVHYQVHDTETRTVKTVASEDVLLLMGAVVKGKPTPYSSLRSSKKDRRSCDGCGIISHCLKQVTDQYSRSGGMQDLCNYCLTFSDNPRLSQEGGLDVCERCTVSGCSNHPQSERARVNG